MSRVRVPPVALALAVTTALALVVTGPALLGRESLGPDVVLDRDPLYARPGALPPAPAFLDTTPIVLEYPAELAFARGLHDGRVDTWTPLSGLGKPLWAEQGGPFFPLKLPFYVAPSRASYDVFLTLRLVAAAMGAWFLARARGRTPTGALTAACLFELCGALVAPLSFGGTSALYMLPWVLLAARAVATSERPLRATAGLALALGVTGLGGHPTIVFLVWSAGGLAFLAHRPWKRLVHGGAAALLGVALAAPAILPLLALDEVGASYKHTEFAGLVRTIFLSHARNWAPISAFAPGTLDLFHAPFHSAFPWILGPVLGLTTLTLAVTGLFLRGLDAALGAVLLLGLGVALIGLDHVPGLKMVLPPYAWALVALPLTQSAGRAVEGWAELRPRWLPAAALVVVGLGGLTLYTVGDKPHPRMLGKTAYATTFKKSVAPAKGFRRLVWPFALAGVTVAAATLIRRRRTGELVAVVAVAELFWLVRPHIGEARSRVLEAPPSPAVAFLQEQMADGQSRFMGTNLFGAGHPQTSLLHGLADVRGLAAIPIRRFRHFMEATGHQYHLTFQTAPHPGHPLMERVGVRWIVGPKAQPPRGQVAYADERVVIVENPRALPRARVARTASVVADYEAARAQLGKTPLVVVEGDVGALPGGPDGPARIRPGRDPDALTVEAEGPGLLVVTDNLAPGWRATVDGEAAAILPVDVSFRGVVLPPGMHTVRFTYRLPGLLPGALLAFAALAAAAALVVVDRRRYR